MTLTSSTVFQTLNYFQLRAPWAWQKRSWAMRVFLCRECLVRVMRNITGKKRDTPRAKTHLVDTSLKCSNPQGCISTPRLQRNPVACLIHPLTKSAGTPIKIWLLAGTNWPKTWKKTNLSACHSDCTLYPHLFSIWRKGCLVDMSNGSVIYIDDNSVSSWCWQPSESLEKYIMH